ncbi:unnamed protein product, partial [Rotaria magnacalcarata]
LCTTTSTNEAINSQPSLLYENLKEVLDNHIQTLLPTLLSDLSESNGYLRVLNSIWNDHLVRS